MKNTNEYNFKLIQLTDVFAGEGVHNKVDPAENTFLSEKARKEIFGRLLGRNEQLVTAQTK